MKNTYAEIFPPGEFLREELEARNWTQQDFARILGKSSRLVNEILNAKRAITPETATVLSSALGTSAQFWMNLESMWQLFQLDQLDDAVPRRAKLYETFPVSDILKRGWVEDSESIEVLETRFCEFFGVSSITETPRLTACFRRTDEDEGVNGLLLSWLYRVRNIAKDIAAPKYSRKSLLQAVQKLEQLRNEPEQVRHVPRILTESGVRFVIVEKFLGTKIDGVCTWLDKSSPVIGMSIRFDRIDNFWFVLRHEIEHVLQKHGQDEQAIIDVGLEGENAGTGESVPEEERIANAAGADFCTPTTEFKSFYARKYPYFYERDITGFAAKLGIHPGLVVGQLHNKTEKYNFLRKYLVNVRKHILPYAIVDGWGEEALIEI